MKQLVLLRHGLAVPSGTPGVEEDERPLTSQGRERTRKVVKRLRPLFKKFDVILTSPLPRALQTAEIAAEVLRLEDRVETTDELLPTSDPSAIRAYLGTRSEGRILVVGHNPSLSDLIPLLMTGTSQSGVFELRKAGAASLRGDESGHYVLDWLIRPRVAWGLG